MEKNKSAFKLYNIIVTFLFFILVEVYIEILLNNPKYIPTSFLSNIRAYYMRYDRKNIQFIDDFSTYDSETFYRLRQGHFKFSNREFDTDFYVNKIGVRDDEKSLDKPEIIVLGDSYAMGWGVDQDSTFANLLETNLDYQILNMGISSFGTAREVKLLDEINTDNLKFLIIQYCSNDYLENKAFLDNKNVLEISSKESYLTACRNQRIKSNYYPFKHVFFNSVILSKRIIYQINGVNKASYTTQEADVFSAFLNVLISAINKIPDDTEIIIFNIDSRSSNGRFIRGIKDKLAEKSHSNHSRRITLLDVSSYLDETDYFILDDHLNSFGHSVVSSMLEQIIKNKAVSTSNKK